MAIKIWKGQVTAKSEVPVSTELNFRKGAKITIVSEGSVFAGNPHPWCGPSGLGIEGRNDTISPKDWVMALLAKTGRTYTPVKGGLLDWSPPTDDNLEFIVNDVPGYFYNNDGTFTVTVKYDDKDLLS